MTGSPNSMHKATLTNKSVAGSKTSAVARATPPMNPEEPPGNSALPLLRVIASNDQRPVFIGAVAVQAPSTGSSMVTRWSA